MAGLVIYDANGNEIMNTTTRVGELLGSFRTNNQATGSFMGNGIAGSGAREFFYFTLNQSDIRGGPVVTRNVRNGQIFWEYNITVAGDYPVGGVPNDTVYYGTY